MEKWSASCIIKEMNITTPMRSLSRLDWFVSLLIIVLVRCKEIRIFIKNGYRFLEGSLTVTIKFNTNAWSRTSILFLFFELQEFLHHLFFRNRDTVGKSKCMPLLSGLPGIKRGKRALTAITTESIFIEGRRRFPPCLWDLDWRRGARPQGPFEGLIF